MDFRKSGESEWRLRGSQRSIGRALNPCLFLCRSPSESFFILFPLPPLPHHLSMSSSFTILFPQLPSLGYTFSFEFFIYFTFFYFNIFFLLPLDQYHLLKLLSFQKSSKSPSNNVFIYFFTNEILTPLPFSHI